MSLNKRHFSTIKIKIGWSRKDDSATIKRFYINGANANEKKVFIFQMAWKELKQSCGLLINEIINYK